MSVGRNISIIRVRSNNPCATLQEIGDRFGITRERVRQILKEAGEQTRAYVQTYLCYHCGKNLGRRKKVFCNKQCQHDYYHMRVPCEICGQLSEYSIAVLAWRVKHMKHKQKLFFCSRVCHGKWLAANYGFTVYPEHATGRPKKWDYSKVYDLRDSKGWGAIKIGRALGMPVPTVSKILIKRREINKGIGG